MREVLASTEQFYLIYCGVMLHAEMCAVLYTWADEYYIY